MQLVEAADPQLHIGRPRRRVERAARGGDGRLRLVDAGIRSMADDLAGGGVDGCEDPAGGDELTVDQQPPIGLRSRPAVRRWAITHSDGGRS